MNAEFAVALDELQPTINASPAAVQERALKMALEIAIAGAGSPVPGAAGGDFWAKFLELFKVLLPLILKLLAG